MSAFYDDVLRLLSNAPLNSHFDKSWTAHVQVKASLYDVEAQLQQGAQCHKDDDIAPEIARLKASPDPEHPSAHLCAGATSCFDHSKLVKGQKLAYLAFPRMIMKKESAGNTDGVHMEPAALEDSIALEGLLQQVQ